MRGIGWIRHELCFGTEVCHLFKPGLLHPEQGWQQRPLNGAAAWLGPQVRGGHRERSPRSHSDNSGRAISES